MTIDIKAIMTNALLFSFHVLPCCLPLPLVGMRKERWGCSPGVMKPALDLDEVGPSLFDNWAGTPLPVKWLVPCQPHKS